MSRQDHVYERRYANLTSPQIRRAALAQVVRYSRPPSRALRGRYALLRDAWRWVADHHRPEAVREVCHDGRG